MPNQSNLLQRKSISALLTFDRILRDPDFSIIHHCGKRKEYEPYLDTEYIRSLTNEALCMELLQRPMENPMELYKIKEFHTEKNYWSMYYDMDQLYHISPMMRMTESVARYIFGGYFSDVYVWNPKDDKRQRYDLFQLYGNHPVLKYITGPFDQVLKQTKPTLVYDWNVQRVFDIVETEEWDATFFFVAGYGYNMEVSETTGFSYLKLRLEERKNVKAFPPYPNDGITGVKG